MTSRDERAALEHFRESYALPRADVLPGIEERVIGGSWGTNGFTTVAQADAIGDVLELAPGMLLLDIGTGRGWPGLYLARKTGCAVIGTDLPTDALVLAVQRAAREGISDRAWFVGAGGEGQPFRAGSFDAMSHTDVLC